MSMKAQQVLAVDDVRAIGAGLPSLEPDLRQEREAILAALSVVPQWRDKLAGAWPRDLAPRAGSPRADPRRPGV